MKINEIVTEEESKWLRPRVPRAQDFAIARPDRQAVRKMLTREGPKILASGIARSLPGVANIFAAVLTVLDVIKGDWVGAGINATGLFFGPAVELPAFAYQLARDHYGEVMYPEDPDPRHLERDMARDPKGTLTAIKNLSTAIADEMQAMAQEARDKVEQSGQAKKKEFATTGGGAAVGYTNR